MGRLESGCGAQAGAPSTERSRGCSPPSPRAASLLSPCLPFLSIGDLLGGSHSCFIWTQCERPSTCLPGAVRHGWGRVARFWGLGWSPTDPRGLLTSLQYVRLSQDTPSSLIYQLMTQKWGLDAPNLLISVTGGAKDFKMKPRLKSVFRRGLLKVAQTSGRAGTEGLRPRPWVVLRPGSAVWARGPLEGRVRALDWPALVGHQAGPRPGPGGKCLIRFTHFLLLYLACSWCRPSSGWLPTDDASKQKHLEKVLRCRVPESRTEGGNREVGESAGPTVRDGVAFLPPPN